MNSRALVFNGLIVLLTAALVGVGVLQWLVYSKQAKLMSDGLAETRKAADAATVSANVSRQTLVISHRAYLHVKQLRVTNWGQATPEVMLHIVNLGQLTAQITGWGMSGVMGNTLPIHRDTTFIVWHGAEGPVAPDQNGVHIRGVMNVALEKGFWAALLTGDRGLSAWGIINYTTGFPDVVGELGFGFEFDPTATHIGDYGSRFGSTSSHGYNYSK